MSLQVVPHGAAAGDRRGLSLATLTSSRGNGFAVTVECKSTTAPKLLAAVVHGLATLPTLTRAVSGSQQIESSAEREAWLAWIAGKATDALDYDQRWALREKLTSILDG